MAYQQWSKDSIDKLSAELTAAAKVADPDLPLDYIDACRRWHAGLSRPNRVLAFIATSAFALGNPGRALQVARMLPPAPPAPGVEPLKRVIH